jgi:hypothetical protein
MITSAPPRVRSLREELTTTERNASDAAWEGNVVREKMLNAVALRLRERIGAGEEWEPTF